MYVCGQVLENKRILTNAEMLEFELHFDDVFGVDSMSRDDLLLQLSVLGHTPLIPVLNPNKLLRWRLGRVCEFIREDDEVGNTSKAVFEFS